MSNQVIDVGASGLADNIDTVATFAALPSAVTSGVGAVRVTVDTGILYVSDGAVWNAAAGGSAVDSVNGQTGSVVLTTTNIAEGTNLYFTTAHALASASSAAASNTVVKRDGSASFAAGLITADTSGNHTGTIDAVATATVVTGAQAANAATAAATSNTIAKRDGFGQLVANGFLGGDLTGNATNVTGVVAIANGGTGQSNQQAGLNNLTNIGGATAGDVLTFSGGNAQFLAPSVSYAAINAAIAAPANSFIFSDNTSQIVGYSNWNINPTTFFSNVDNFYHPNNLSVAQTTYGWNINVAPLQNSPNDSMNLHNFSVNLDSAATGFNFGGNGQAAVLLNGGYNYGGNGATFGTLRYISLSGSLGNGIDPGTLKGFQASGQGIQIAANITLDGQFQGYDFNLNVNAAAISTSNFNVLWLTDFSQILIDLYGYQGVVCQPTIATIKNNHYFNGISVNPNITTLEGNAGFGGFVSGGTIATLGTGGYTGININANITTMAATANFNGLTLSSQIATMGATSQFVGAGVGPTITTAHGNVTAFQANPQIAGGDANVNLFQGNVNSVTTSGSVSVLDLNGLTADGKQSSASMGNVRFSASGVLVPLSAQTIQSQHVIFTSFAASGVGAITGTDILCNIFSPDIDFGTVTDTVALGPSGLGVAMVAFAGQCHGHGQIDLLSAVIPTAIFADDFTLGEWRNVNAHVINAGYTGVCAEATAFYHDVSGAGLFATTHWGLRVVTDGIENYVPKIAINTASQKVASANVRLQIENGHIKSSQTTGPTVAAAAGAGTGASASITNATDIAGNVELDLGTLTLASGAQLTVTFNQTYAVAPIVNITPNNGPAAANSAAFGIYVTSSTTTFTINFATAGVALTTLKWNYQVIETQ